MKNRARLREALYFLALLTAAAALLLHPERASAAVVQGLRLCGGVILPSLFPFFVCAALMTELSLTHIPARLFAPVMRPLFHVGGAGSAALALGLLGGYPAGAQVTVQLYKSGCVTRQEAERLLCFCNNAGPAFLLGVTGMGVYGSVRVGLILWGVHVLCAFLTGVLLRGHIASPQSDACAQSASARREPAPFASAFTASVRHAGAAAMQVCMFVLIFSVLAAFLLCLLPPATPPALRALAVGMLELSNGVCLLEGRRTLPLAAFLLGFSGLSVAAQAQSLLAGSGLSFRRYLPAKLLHGALSALLMWPLSALPAVQGAAVPAFSGAALPLAALYAPLWAAGGIICLVFRKLMAGNPPPKRV